MWRRGAGRPLDADRSRAAAVVLDGLALLGLLALDAQVLVLPPDEALGAAEELVLRHPQHVPGAPPLPRRHWGRRGGRVRRGGRDHRGRLAHLPPRDHRLVGRAPHPRQLLAAPRLALPHGHRPRRAAPHDGLPRRVHRHVVDANGLGRGGRGPRLLLLAAFLLGLRGGASGLALASGLLAHAGAVDRPDLCRSRVPRPARPDRRWRRDDGVRSGSEDVGFGRREEHAAHEGGHVAGRGREYSRDGGSAVAVGGDEPEPDDDDVGGDPQDAGRGREN